MTVSLGPTYDNIKDKRAPDLNDFRMALDDFDGAFGPVAHKFGMNWVFARCDRRPRVAIFVSKFDHYLVDLLHRRRNGELACDFTEYRYEFELG